MDLQTALLIIPPPEVQAFAAPLRRSYAPDIYMQGPAHLTLFYPFVPAGEILATSMKLRSICSNITPFKLTLDKYDHFEATVFLAPSNPDLVLSFHRLLLSAFPEYLPYEGQYGTKLTPHLTLAHDEAPERIKDIILPPTPSFTFIVDQIHLYLGPAEGNIPWIPVAIIPLGGGE
jgi:2'-5' RNA ligase